MLLGSRSSDVAALLDGRGDCTGVNAEVATRLLTVISVLGAVERLGRVRSLASVDLVVVPLAGLMVELWLRMDETEVNFELCDKYGTSLRTSRADIEADVPASHAVVLCARHGGRVLAGGRAA